MTRVAIDISDEAHIRLLELQLERKKKKIEPTAINKIAAEIVETALKQEKPAK